MTKILSLSSIALLIASTQSYAHHPAVDMVDPEIYAMIEENISDAHLDLTFDDMGGNSTDAGSPADSVDNEVGNMASEMRGSMESDVESEMSSNVESMESEMGGNVEDISAVMESRADMNSMADIETAGSMNGKR